MIKHKMSSSTATMTVPRSTCTHRGRVTRPHNMKRERVKQKILGVIKKTHQWPYRAQLKLTYSQWYELDVFRGSTTVVPRGAFPPTPISTLHDTVTLMFSSSSSPSHLLSLAPPTISSETTGFGGSKLSASEKQKPRVRNFSFSYTIVIIYKIYKLILQTKRVHPPHSMITCVRPKVFPWRQAN